MMTWIGFELTTGAYCIYPHLCPSVWNRNNLAIEMQPEVGGGSKVEMCSNHKIPFKLSQFEILPPLKKTLDQFGGHQFNVRPEFKLLFGMQMLTIFGN